MARYGLLLLLLFAFCGCGREKIDAAGAAVEAAWGEFGRGLTAPRDLLGSLEGPVCAAADGKEACAQLREAITTMAPVDLARIDPTDRAAVEPVRRSLRSLGQAVERLDRFAGKEPLPEGAPLSEIARFKRQVEQTRADAERYDTAVLTYNRALRTFPESVTNNMFLRLKSREYLNTDRRARKLNAEKR